MVRVRIPPAFLKALRSLSEPRRKRAIGRLHLFQARPNDPALRLRPFRAVPGFFLIDLPRGDRILLRKEGSDTYAAIDVGGHELYPEWERLRDDGDSAV